MYRCLHAPRDVQYFAPLQKASRPPPVDEVLVVTRQHLIQLSQV